MGNIFYPILQMIGSLEHYQERSLNKQPEDIRKICREAKSLLTILGEHRVSDWELRRNSAELKGFINSLRTLSDESEQEQIDEELVRVKYLNSLKYAPEVLREIVEFYSLFGPENKEDEL